MKSIKSILATVFVVMLLFTATGWFGGAGNPQSQETVFTVGDTAELFNVANASTILLTVVDSALAGVDTIKCQIVTGLTVNRFSLVAMHNLAQPTATTNDTLLIPTNGLTRTYEYKSNVPISKVNVYRTNESTNDAYAPRTRIVLTSY